MLIYKISEGKSGYNEINNIKKTIINTVISL